MVDRLRHHNLQRSSENRAACCMFKEDKAKESRGDIISGSSVHFIYFREAP